MKRIILASLLFLSLTSFAQDKYLQSETETQDISKKVTGLFSENKISKAISEIAPFWPLPKNEIDALEEKSIRYLNMVEERFGKPIGIAKVNNETISDFAIRETYLVRYEFTAIRLKFTYYKSKKGWIVNAFKWDDSFSDEFK